MPTLCHTDGYKFSMGEAGAPLREESFYYSHRKGGWSYNPLDIESFVRGLLPTPTADDYAFLDRNNYRLGGAYRQAVTQADTLRVNAIPKGAWLHDREPVFTVTGPSALVSWLEPTLLQINRRIQVATCALLTPAQLPGMVQTATCDEEAEITRETLASLGLPAPAIRVARDEYADSVRVRAERLVAIVGDPNRLFEVGMRAASCQGQHRIALGAIRAAGILRTSNVGLAAELDMIPVGTMGHEHVQRHGDDYAAYTAMRDRFPGFIFYLPDTFDTIGSGIPNALRVMAEAPSRNAGIRFDSEHGIRGHYLYAVCRARELGMTPYLGLESGWNEALTAEFEALRTTVGWPAERQGYGLGNYLVKPEWPHFGRDSVSAVWKVCWSGRGVMKFGDEPGHGKESIPGRPVLWRPHLGMSGYTGPVGFVAQEGEAWAPPVPATLLSGADALGTSVRFSVSEVQGFAQSRCGGLAYSPATQALVSACHARRLENLRRATDGA